MRESNDCAQRRAQFVSAPSNILNIPAGEAHNDDKILFLE